MPVLTPNGPYYDRFDATKGYHKVLFKPTTSVQVGELNEFQTILQNQIEKFGDNIFKKGTVIDGCNFVYHNSYPYVKISDVSDTGSTVNPTQMEGLFAVDSNGLKAYIVDSVEGYESTSPDLKTLYIKYTNAGDDLTAESFTPGDVLEIKYGNNGLFGITVNNRGTGFSNTDSMVFTSAVMIRVESGTFTNGEYITCEDTGSNVQIIGVETTDSDNLVILKLAPRTADLANGDVDSTTWTVNTLDVIHNIGNTVIGTVVKQYGTGAVGRIQTDASGRITSTILNYSGAGYSIVPHVTVRSIDNLSGLGTLSLTGRNYLTKVNIPGSGDSVGNGYAFSIGEGVIYQKGYFIRVEPQTVVVSKYSQTPNNISVGFTTEEKIISAAIDPDLLDNVLETDNRYAYGADRLQLIPTLYTVNTDVAQSNTEFLPLVEWNQGNPYKVNQVTNYSKIGDEMATRTKDASGNFVLDPFLVTTDSVTNAEMESQSYSVIIDPGSAYIDGYRVKTLANYRFDLNKGTDTKISNNQKISINYDKYIRISEAGGLFQFSTGDTVKLYDTAKGFLSNTTYITTANTTPPGSQIGTARIRSMVLENGTPGDPTAIYKLYLFDISTRPGKNFKNAKSVYYDGTAYKGIADVVLETDATTGSNVAILYGAQNDALVFPTRFESIRNSNNTTYTYRTIDQTTATGNNGILTKSIVSSPDEFYPYSGTLSSTQLKELYIVPVSRDLVAYTSLTGAASCNTTSINVIGSGTTFINDLKAGDYITLSPNASANAIKKVVSVVNNTFLTLDSNCSFANTSTNLFRTFPKNVPVPFGTRSGLSANVDAGGNILTVNFGTTFAGTTSANTLVGVNIERTNISSTSKTANRNRYVKLRLSNAAANTVGPWCLGVPDAIRLKNVYIGTSTVNVDSTSVASDFYIDNNQTVDYLGLSYLYKHPKSGLTLESTDYLLVEFDYMVRSDDGYFDTTSYLGTSNAEQISTLDSLAVDDLTTSACSWEVPEMHTKTGKYYDMLNCFDFRPAAANTVAPSITVAGAPINPGSTLSFGNTADPANSKKFPLPGTICRSDIEHYMGRLDTVIIGGDGYADVIEGTYSADPVYRREAAVPTDALKLQTIVVPPYPNITENISQAVNDVVNTRIVNEVILGQRIKDHRIHTTLNANNVAIEQPKAYTMSEISQLERRLKVLEYYNGLTLLETSITNKVIPSSIDNSVNRFKFGFFVDDFSSTLYSELKNPQYAASLETASQIVNYQSLTSNTISVQANNLIAPPKFVFGIPHNFTIDRDNTTVGSRKSYTIATQRNATDIPVVCNTELQVVYSNTSGGGYSNAYFYRSGTVSLSNWGVLSHSVTATDDIAFGVDAAVAGPAKLFWATRDREKRFVSVDPYFAVRQTTNSSIRTLDSISLYGHPGDLVAPVGASFNISTLTPIVTSANSRAITNNEFIFLASNPYAADFMTLASSVGATVTQQNFFKTNGLANGQQWIANSVAAGTLSNFLADDFIALGQGWVSGVGEIDFTFDPSKGKTLIITTTSADDPYANSSPAGGDGGMPAFISGVDFVWLLVLPVATTSNTGIVVDPCGAATTTNYNGTMQISTNFSISAVPSLKQYDYVTVSCSGLKPSSKHLLFINGINNTNVINKQVRPVGGNFGDSIITGPDGKVNFEVYYPDSMNTSGLNVTRNNTVNVNMLISRGYSSLTIPEFSSNNTFKSSYDPLVTLELKTAGSSCKASSSLFFDNI